MKLNPNTYTDAGEGETIVFLHGFCESKELWTDFVKPLQNQFRIVTLDLPGFGQNTETQPDDYSMEAMAEYVHKVIKQLQIKKPLVVGHSLGGYVALALAEAHPRLMSGMCLFHSSAKADTKEKKENRNKSIDFIKKHGVQLFMQSFVGPLFYPGNKKKCSGAIEKLTLIGAATPKETVIGVMKAMRDREKRTKVLKEAKYPILFILGKDDPAVPLEAALEQVHLPTNSMTYFLAETGHMGMFERTYETRKSLQKFAETIFG